MQPMSARPQAAAAWRVVIVMQETGGETANGAPPNILGRTMPIDPLLIERIYEAAALPDRWPDVLQDIADRVYSRGAVIVTQECAGVSWVSSPRMERDIADYFAAGWRMEHIAGGLMADLHPGFRTETDYLPVDRIHRLPVHAEFFDPRGYPAGAGTVVQGSKDDLLLCVLEGFATHDAAAAAVPWLDGLRAPLARALSLSARLRTVKATSGVAALDVAGVSAAVISGDGRLRAANGGFLRRLGDRMIDNPAGLRFVDRFLQAQFAGALAAMGATTSVRSIGVAARGEEPAFVIHLLPLRRAARDVFGWDGVLLLLAEGANASVPGADLLRLLFDLTPAEARLTRHLLEGRTPAEAAMALGIAQETARTHLRRIFAKTGVARQSDLLRLLMGLGAPE